jgi:hypothetical protein
MNTLLSYDFDNGNTLEARIYEPDRDGDILVEIEDNECTYFNGNHFKTYEEAEDWADRNFYIALKEIEPINK